MASRKLPNSIPTLLKAILAAIFKWNFTSDPADQPFDAVMKGQLDTMKTDLEKEVGERDVAKGDQTDATKAYETAKDTLGLYVSHFFQVFNFGVARGDYSPGERSYFGMDANQEQLPDLDDEANLEFWANKVVSGDADRVAAGKVAMTNPTAADVALKITDYTNAKGAQTTLKDATQQEQADVNALYQPAKLLVTDVWDTVEFFFRKLDKPTLRRRAREWGVVYINNPGEPVEYLETVIPKGGTVNMAGVDLASATSIIVENGATKIAVCRATDAASACDITGSLVNENETVTLPVAGLAGSGNSLNFTNADSVNDGFVKVTVIY